MQALEKYRDYKLISKILGFALLYDAGTSILGMFIKMIRYEYYPFSIWTIIYALVPAIAGVIFLLNKYQDKMLKLAFSGVMVLSKLIMLIRSFTGNPSAKYVFSNFMGLIIAVAFSVYYLGFINPSGNKNFLKLAMGLMGVLAVLRIFSLGSFSIGGLGLYFIMMMYAFPETRTTESNYIYIGMIGTAYYVAYTAISDLLGMFSVYLPVFFSYSCILICMVMPLLVFDRIVPGQGMPLFTINPNALSGAPAPQQPVYAQQNGFAQQPNNFAQQNQGFAQQQPVPPQQNNFVPQPQQQGFVQPQQNNFDPMTGQPLNPQPQQGFAQQNNFDPMTGQPLNPQPNRFDPMTGKPIDPNGGQQ